MALMKQLRSSLVGTKAESIGEKAGDLRARGDSERDARNWESAAALYLEHLNKEPTDFAIWVQRGNCLKEAGDLAGAEEAYRRAIALNEEDSDVHLQLGHLMKRAHRLDEAVKSYQRSLDLDPGLSHALSELKALGISVSSSRRGLERLNDSPILYLDIYDLIAFLRQNLRVTGIQRVVAGILSSHLESGSSTTNVQYCAASPDDDGLIVFDPGRLRGLVSYISSPWVDRDILDKILGDLLDQAILADTRPGDVYVILGAFWIVQDYGIWLLRLKEKGVLIGTYIYDLIPITHPQFVTESSRDAVNERYIEVFLLTDFFLTISEYVASEVQGVLKSEANVKKPVRAVPLAHQLPKSNATLAISDALLILAERPFVLSVCTLEGRKNHALLYRVWSSMVRKYGFANVPELVLVGKWGWRIEEFVTMCNSDNFLNGKIIIQSDLRDHELAYLYEQCLFTVFPSFVEGWGLPVGESLAFGKPCLASNTTSIPEVGGDLVVYFNPYDVFGATEVIERAIFDSQFVPSLARRIEAEFKPRSWADVTETFLATVEDCASSLRADRARVALPYRASIRVEAGKLYEISGVAISRSQISWAQKLIRLVRYSGWHALEPWGTWSAKRRAEVRFDVGNEHVGRTATVYLELKLPPGGAGSVVITDGQRSSSVITSLNSDPKWVKYHMPINSEGVLQIFVEARGVTKTGLSGDTREIFVGFSGLGYHLDGDIGSRLNIVEELLVKNGIVCIS
jgi:glycosyltransferase involved in cell wall biosynthesis